MNSFFIISVCANIDLVNDGRSAFLQFFGSGLPSGLAN